MSLGCEGSYTALCQGSRWFGRAEKAEWNTRREKASVIALAIGRNNVQQDTGQKGDLECVPSNNPVSQESKRTQAVQLPDERDNTRVFTSAQNSPFISSFIN